MPPLPDVRDFARRLHDLMAELPDPAGVPPDLPARQRSAALRSLRTSIQRLQSLANALNPDDNITRLVHAATDLADAVPQLEDEAGGLADRRRKKLREDLYGAVHALGFLAERLDPIAQPDAEFDPSDPHVIGQLIAKAMIGRDRRPLVSIADNRFYGSGVYALYYSGAFPSYRPISGTDHPIYVGKADPRDVYAGTAAAQGQGLWVRLARDHLGSLRNAANLDPADFDCRYLVVRSAWQTTAEDYLIRLFHPIWNNQTKVCFGFGKHGDRAATRTNTVSPWDTLHPGRPWATGGDNRPNPKSANDIATDIARHFDIHPPAASVETGVTLPSSEREHAPSTP